MIPIRPGLGGGPLAGKLVVATPLLRDPNFKRTVVLILHHDGNGALGIVVNRPLEIPTSFLEPGWAARCCKPAVAFGGGPVELSAVICLGRIPTHDPTGQVADELVIVDLESTADSNPARSLRVFSGYAGWGCGQLEDEIGNAAWFVIAAEPGDAFDPAPTTLWRRVLARQPGRLAWYASFPRDPSLN